MSDKGKTSRIAGQPETHPPVSSPPETRIEPARAPEANPAVPALTPRERWLAERAAKVAALADEALATFALRAAPPAATHNHKPISPKGGEA